MPQISEIFKNNIPQLIGFVFGCGLLFGRIEFLQYQVDVLENRLKKKIEIIDELDERIDDLEKCNH